MWPSLVPHGVCKTPCRVILTGGEGEDCTPVVAAAIDARCSWQDSPRQVLDANRQLIQLAGSALFPGDLAPQVDLLTGTVTIYGTAWTIYKGSKCRNPDGTVNYTRLELM